MNVTKEQVDALNASLKFKITPEDYEDRVNKAIKATQKKAQMPGFRPGMVPMGVVKKMYGKSILADELNKLLYDSINNYIAENKLEILGNPLPKVQESGAIDFETQKEFEFSYEIGLAPQFAIDFSGASALNYYKINVDNELIDKYTIDICRRYGNVSSPEKIEDKDLINCEIKELNDDGNPNENGISVVSFIALDKISNNELKNNLIGKEKDFVFTAQANDLSDNAGDLSAMLKITKEQAENLNSRLEVTINSISRMMPAELNQELWDKVYGKDVIKSTQEFNAKLTDEINNMFSGDSDARFKYDVFQYFLKKLQINLPDDFLKRWIISTNEKPITIEQVNIEYDSYAKSLKNQMIENKIIKEYNINVEAAEAIEYAKRMLKDQYFKYSPDTIDDNFLEDTAKKVMAKPEDAKRIYDRVYDTKLLSLYKEKFSTNEVALDYDDFIKKLNEA